MYRVRHQTPPPRSPLHRRLSQHQYKRMKMRTLCSRQVMEFLQHTSPAMPMPPTSEQHLHRHSASPKMQHHLQQSEPLKTLSQNLTEISKMSSPRTHLTSYPLVKLGTMVLIWSQVQNPNPHVPSHCHHWNRKNLTTFSKKICA